MSAVDFLDQWFETDVLKATMAASGIIGTFLGVRSPGTAYVLLHHYMGEIDGAFRSWGLSRGGTGAISNAIARRAREAGAEIRTETTVSKIIVKDGAAVGVVLENGDYLTASVVLVERRSAPDVPARWSATEHLPDEFVADVRRYKFRGSSGKVNLALDALPDFTCLPGTGPAPARRHLDLAEHRLHGARLRRGEVRPLLAAALHRHRDSEPDRSVGRAARQARDVVLRAVRAVSPEGGNVGRATRGVRRHRHQHHRRVRAEHPATSSCTARSLTPLDLEREFGLTEGNIFQGELTLEQLFFLRPAPGWAQYRTPIKNLYMCGSATHPGGGIMGAPGRNAARRILRDRGGSEAGR